MLRAIGWWLENIKKWDVIHTSRRRSRRDRPTLIPIFNYTGTDGWTIGRYFAKFP
jgi:hypothetical protein